MHALKNTTRARLRPWFVLRVQSRRERWAAENVERQAGQYGTEYYLPMISEGECLFPGYLFVRTGHGAWRFLEGTYGVIEVLKSGERPAVLRPDEMGHIRRLEIDGTGLVRLPNVFERDELVRVQDGPFIGYTGLVEGMSARDRVRVLLGVMGRETPVELHISQLEREPKRSRPG